MKASFTAVGASAVVVLVSAAAGTRTSHAIHPESLARIEAISSYCEKADPSSESQYLSKLAGLMSGHSDDEIQRDRTSSKYQRAMVQANETLSKVSGNTAVRACNEFLAETE
jgi:hypothetical protein